MHRYKILTTLLISAGLLATKPSAGQGFLKAQGKIIVNGKGEKVILRGMGLGGWMLQEGYMYRVGNLGQQYKIRSAIEGVIGAEKTARFYEKWLSNHMRKVDVDSMARWGFNSVRLPMHFDLFTPPADKEPVAGKNTWLPKGFSMVDELLKWCKANKIYLILDLHAAPGGQGNDLPISDRHPEQPSLWQSEANQQKMIALWAKLAQRYANEPYIGGYDIINEPNWGFEDAEDKRGTKENTNAPLKKLMMDITAAIRKVDKNHIVIIEGNAFGNNYRGVLPPWDNNMVLSFHKYGNFNTKGAIQGFIDLREKYNVPLWLGESGENSNTWFTECISLVESNDIGWSWWPLKKIGINNPQEIKMPEGYQKLVDFWSGKGEKPTAAEAEKTLNKLLENLKFENNIIHHDVIDAMFRQVKSAETKPFKRHVIGANTTIWAADFDLGRQRSAYYDKDTASYQYTPGVNTQGNRGRSYRNDGVDIRLDNNEPYVFNIEDGEWLQYTVQASKAGTYNVKLTVAADKDGGKVSIGTSNNFVSAQVPNTGGQQTWQTIELKDVKLKQGLNKIRVRFDVGGFNFKTMTWVK